MGILMTFLQIKEGYCIVMTSYGRGTAETSLLDAVRTGAEQGLVVVSQCFWTGGERNTPVDSLRTILGTRDRFTYIAQEERTGCQYLDVDEAEHLHLLDMGDEFGTMTMTGVGITIYRTVGLVDTGYMSQDIGGSPRRAAFVGIWVVARERHVGTYLIEGLLIAAYNS